MAGFKQESKARVDLDYDETAVLEDAKVVPQDFAERCRRTGATVCIRAAALNSPYSYKKIFKSGSAPSESVSCGLGVEVEVGSAWSFEFACQQQPCGDANAAMSAAKDVADRVERIEDYSTSVQNARNR